MEGYLRETQQKSRFVRKGKENICLGVDEIIHLFKNKILRWV